MEEKHLNYLLVFAAGAVMAGLAVHYVNKRSEEFELEDDEFGDDMDADEMAELVGYEDEDMADFEGEDDFDETGEPPPALRDWDKHARKAKLVAKRSAQAARKGYEYVAPRAKKAAKKSYEYAAPKVASAAKASYEYTKRKAPELGQKTKDYALRGAKALDSLTYMQPPTAAPAVSAFESRKTLFGAPAPQAFEGSYSDTAGAYAGGRRVAKTLVETPEQSARRLFGDTAVDADLQQFRRERETRVSRPNGRKRRNRSRHA